MGPSIRCTWRDVSDVGITHIYNESMELLSIDWISFWAIGGESYDILLQPMPIIIG